MAGEVRGRGGDGRPEPGLAPVPSPDALVGGESSTRTGALLQDLTDHLRDSPWARRGLGLVLGLLALVAGGYLLDPPRPDERAARPYDDQRPTGDVRHEITGLFALSRWHVDEQCRGRGGYAGIGEGTEVVVTDGTGTVLARGSLGPGLVQAPSDTVEQGIVACEYGITVADVPWADVYRIGLRDRALLTYTYTQLQESGWNVGFTLG